MKKFLLINALNLVIVFSFAQTKTPPKPVKMPPVISKEPQMPPALLSIFGETISKEEFERVFHKNNYKDSASDEKAVREYLELYINYKLKVKEAEAEKMRVAATEPPCQPPRPAPSARSTSSINRRRPTASACRRRNSAPRSDPSRQPRT